MTNPNDCAYPADSQTQTEGGLTKREYIATKLMSGILASLTEKAANGRWSEELTEVAVIATIAADELINALNQTK